MRLVIGTSLKQVNLVWSTLSVLKADPPASYPGKHADFLLSMVLQSPHTLLIGSKPSREDSFYRCAVYTSRTASTHHTYTGPQPISRVCSMLLRIGVPRRNILRGNSPVPSVISALHFTPRFFLNHVLQN